MPMSPALTRTLAAITIGLSALSTMPVQAQTALKSALDGNAPPYAMPKIDGSIEGLTVDMTQEIARRIGRTISIDAMGFAALLPALQAGTYDMLSVPLVATAERADTFLLTEGLWAADLVFLLPKAAPQVNAYAQFKGRKIATNKGNAYEKWAREKAPEYGWIVESYGSLTDAAQAVQAGRADAALVGTATAHLIAQRTPALKVSELSVSTGQYYSYAIAKRNAALRPIIERAIECIKADGTAARLYQKWIGVAPAKGALEVTPQPGTGPVGLGNHDATAVALSCGKV